ncbi:uncharacterized protein LOC108899402 [Lates calcarifer]|uniref:Uncharacterized protein LOC108899402 n=1 Tax=Lates calcarifer TaxID=8187 RepID=A0AAJ8DUF2_LATCA|nr:uncharacterized protein LOC108899402 [Lates calcarifer]
MFIFIWATLFFFVRGNNAGTASFYGGKQHCTQNNYCVTLTEGEISAETRLPVVLQCSFTTAADFDVKSVIWYKCDPFKQRCDLPDKQIFSSSNNRNIQSGFRGRVSLLEPDVSQKNCGIIISGVRESDAGSYQLRVGGFLNGVKTGFTFESKANITVTDPAQHCGPCSTGLPWAIAGVSLIVNIVYTVCVVFLWDANKKLKANQEERCYVPLQKTDSSPVYDVIGEPLN